jgi:hypothetical protein
LTSRTLDASDTPRDIATILRLISTRRRRALAKLLIDDADEDNPAWNPSAKRPPTESLCRML